MARNGFWHSGRGIKILLRGYLQIRGTLIKYIPIIERIDNDYKA